MNGAPLLKGLHRVKHELIRVSDFFGDVLSGVHEGSEQPSIAAI